MKKKSANKNDTNKDTLGAETNKDTLGAETNKDTLGADASELEDVEADVEEADVEEADVEEADVAALQRMDKLSELKKATDIKISSNFHISKKINDAIFAYVNVHPDVARQAMEIANQEHSIIYLNYLQ